MSSEETELENVAKLTGGWKNFLVWLLLITDWIQENINSIAKGIASSS